MARSIRATAKYLSSKCLKVPTYSIQNYKQEKEQREIEIAKELERRNLPPGMRLMEEQERQEMLQALQNTKKELQFEIERMPITMKTMSMQKRRDELEEKYRNIEK